MNTSIQPMSLVSKNLLCLSEFSSHEIENILNIAIELKSDYKPFNDSLSGKSMVMLFEKPSLRTRMSFEVGFAKLGGNAIYLDHQDNRLGERESIADYARNLERWVDVIVSRTFKHDTLEQLAGAASIPVINALSDLYHPCQALADALTLKENFADLNSLKLAYIGDGNNVCNSLLLIAAKLGFDITIISPSGYAPNPKVVSLAEDIASSTSSTINLSSDIQAAEGHHAIYTDTWFSMGQEQDQSERKEHFCKYQVTEQVMANADSKAIFMHCLPAHRGQEVAAEVIDSPKSVVFDQAENRMHAQNALMLCLLGSH